MFSMELNSQSHANDSNYMLGVSSLGGFVKGLFTALVYHVKCSRFLSLVIQGETQHSALEPQITGMDSMFLLKTY